MSERIRVLHPITRLIIGGAQENTVLTAHMLDPEQWEVDVLYGPQTGPEGTLVPTAQDLGVSLLCEPQMVREVNPLADLRALIRLTRLMRRGNYAIVHTHSSKAGIIGRWAAKFAGTPVIIHTVHGWGHHSRQHPLVRRIYVWLEKRSLPITSKLIAVSARNVQDGLADGIGTPEDYVVIRSGIELDRFGHPAVTPAATRARWGIPTDALVIGTVTRLSPQKAPHDFVRAAALIAEQRPNVVFVLVGDGPLRAEVTDLARDLGLDDRVVFTGLRRDVPELMAAFDIFALSSLWEGLPRVLPQAMATGLPIVATAADGSAEAIEEGVNGFLTPPGRPDALAAALLRLIDDAALRRQMGAAGRARVGEFDAVDMVQQIDTLYRTLLAEHVAST
ncbi:MAG: glycosyltransferase family 4 protein [Caldilineaceae bacterium]|nr:glycosyltransferase family 4 protein [Caldilineaceae bacterium]